MTQMAPGPHWQSSGPTSNKHKTVNPESEKNPSKPRTCRKLTVIWSGEARNRYTGIAAGFDIVRIDSREVSGTGAVVSAVKILAVGPGGASHHDTFIDICNGARERGKMIKQQNHNKRMKQPSKSSNQSERYEVIEWRNLVQAKLNLKETRLVQKCYIVSTERLFFAPFMARFFSEVHFFLWGVNSR